MNRIGVVILGLLLAVTFSPAQDAASAAPASVGHGAFPVTVSKTLDSSKLKEGDSVELETGAGFKLANGTLVPKGSKLTGHVTASKARSKGDSDSQLTLAFDKLDVANGKQLSVKGMVQAVFPATEEAEPLMAGKASGAAGGGYADATVGTVTEAKTGANAESTSQSQTSMTPKSMGAHGIHDLSLEDGVLSSKGKQVKLGNGVRMIVRVDILG
jgi:hypothetical protein